MRAYLHYERHGSAIVLAKPEHRKDKDYPLSAFVFVFCVSFLFTVVWEGIRYVVACLLKRLLMSACLIERVADKLIKRLSRKKT